MARQNCEQKYKGGDGTGQEDMENIIGNRRLKWINHVFRMDKDRRVNQPEPGIALGS